MLCTNGQILHSDSKKIDTDYDALEDGEEVKMCISPSYTIPANVPSYIRNGITNHYIFTEISDPMNEDTDGDGIEDHIDETPINKTTLEAMYKLSKKNKPENPIYIDIKENTVNIIANIYFNDFGLDLYTYKDEVDKSNIEIAAEAIENMWSVSFKGTDYNFVKGIKIKVVTKVNVWTNSNLDSADKNQNVLHVNLYNEWGTSYYHIPGFLGVYNKDLAENWSVNQKDANIELYTGDHRNNIGTYTLEDYQETSAHEFGHALGLADLYTSNYTKNDEIDTFDIMDSSTCVQDNDIEMVLQAYTENKMQYFFTKDGHTQSKAIKLPLFYEN